MLLVGLGRSCDGHACPAGNCLEKDTYEDQLCLWVHTCWRSKHIYHQVLAGVRVDALEVEAVLCSHSAVAQAAVKGVRALAGVELSGECCL